MIKTLKELEAVLKDADILNGSDLAIAMLEPVQGKPTNLVTMIDALTRMTIFAILKSGADDVKIAESLMEHMKKNVLGNLKKLGFKE